MIKAFPEKERNMYPIIREYLLSSGKCDQVFVDGDETFVRLEKNSHIRKVDLAALKDPNRRTSQIHLIEAKLLTKGHSFEECFSQIDSVRDSADRLWVAFPETQWRSLPEADRQRNEKRLNDHGVGLLLVDPTRCSEEITASPNKEVTESGRTEVLRQLGFAAEQFIPDVQTLGQVEAQKAAGVMVVTCMVAEILYAVEKKRFSFHRYWDSPYEDDSVSKGWYVPSVQFEGSVDCQLDPFGCFTGDGVPTAWVGVDVPIEKIHARLEQDSGFGTHVYLDDGDWRWKMIPVADGKEAINHWVNRGLNVTANLCARVEILGRMRSSLKFDLERVLKEARTFLAADTKPS